jgi:UDP:flavonoid glycosyltransferase YjiC (YdhE family)
MVSAGFGEGHAFPALALAGELRARGHRVLVELSERWRDTVTGLGMEFTRALDYAAFPAAASPGPKQRTVVESVEELRPVLAAFSPDLVVADMVAPAPGLAAELAGVPWASLIPLVYPVQGRGLPPFEHGFVAPRTRLSRALWAGLEPATRPWRGSARWLTRVPVLVDATRAELGLPPLARDRSVTTYGALSEELALVATFPQLEYPRRWPAHVHVTGPLAFELPHPDVGLPPGDDPLIVVAPSTVHSGEELLRATLRGLETEPVRVIATLNRRGMRWSDPVPPNAKVVDWVSYSQVLSGASAVVTSGGHGTVGRSLCAGVPPLVVPAGAETAENGARVTWAGAGLMVPRRLLAPISVRAALGRLLEEERFAARAGELANWAAANDGARRGAEVIESYAAR